jgi:transcriptional regulator with PAS, ATPase and Fis domain
VVLGREIGALVLDDTRLSREHARVRFDGKRWTVEDLGSTNGTFVDGVKVHRETTAEHPRVIRAGATIFLPFADAARHGGAPRDPLPALEGVVAGASFRRALDDVVRTARTSEQLLVVGESGTGKEIAARAFHAAGPHAAGPLVSVNCATIPSTLAERLMFGARRGAYSGANEDVGGYVDAAENGVLFLDELGELPLDLQAKLLRLVETREYMMLGASRTRRARTRFCFATNRDLRGEIAAGRFRADLFYRVAEPMVTLPPLRERLEEVPALVADAIARVGGSPPPHVKLVEACLLLAWPGNVRELLGSVASAARAAIAAEAASVAPQHLPHGAGTGEAQASAGPQARADERTSDEILQALEREGGNTAAAARALQMHRTQLYRRMNELGIRGRGRG